MTSFDPDALENLIKGYAEADLDKNIQRAVAQTGILSLDLMLGGGLPPGIVEVFGEPSVGKTAFAGQVIAHNQRREDFAVGIFPSEHIDNEYFTNLGVDLPNLPVLKRDDLSSFLRDFPRALLVIDSLTAMVPKEEDRNEYLYQFLDAMVHFLRPGQCVLVTSHVRTNTSIEPGRTFTKGTRSAARRLSDFFVTRLQLSREEVSPPKYTQTVNIVANVLAPPAQFIQLHCRMGYGVNVFRDLVETAVKTGVLTKSGSHYYLDDRKLGRDIKTTQYAVVYDSDVEAEIVRRVLSSISG